MCRAVWVVVVAASDAAAKQIRRALGPEAQVVLVTSDVSDPAIRSTQADALVVDGDAEGARELVAGMATGGTKILWLGDEAPDGATNSTVHRDQLESALTRTLISKR